MLKTFINILHKVPDKDILIQDNISTACVAEFTVQTDCLILILKHDASKFYSVRSLVRRLLPLKGIKNIFVFYGISYYKVTGLKITQDKVIIDSHLLCRAYDSW